MDESSIVTDHTHVSANQCTKKYYRVHLRSLTSNRHSSLPILQKSGEQPNKLEHEEIKKDDFIKLKLKRDSQIDMPPK